MLTVGSLFSGIGGFDLGLERTGGFRTAWFCEQDPYCQRVLAHHWPDVRCYPDIRMLCGNGLPEPRIPVPSVDVLCGGFPCQDLSYAGAGAGIDGARSGLWSEYARLVGELRPRYVVVENVAALLARGLGRVLGDLAALGYDAEWDCIPASAVGAPHQRDRLWLVAYPSRDMRAGTTPARPIGQRTRTSGKPGRAGRDTDTQTTQGMADAQGERGRPGLRGVRQDRRHTEPRDDRGGSGGPDWWAVEPDVGRVAYGVPARVDRLRALGNALVPQIAEWIGQRIVSYEAGAI